MQIQDLNKELLSELLIIDDLDKESIYSILGRMNSLLEIFRSNKSLNHLESFLFAYIAVTKRITEKIVDSKERFEDVELIEKFNNYFASLYFKPLHDYLIDGVTSTPWSSYFKFSESSKSHPLVQLLLGANVHINSDLCQAVVDFDYKSEKDFATVQGILFDAIPEIMRHLAFEEKDLLGLGGLVLNEFYKSEFEKVVIKWRNNSRRNAEIIIADKSKLQTIQNETDQLGEKIIQAWGKFYNPLNIISFLKDLNSLEIIL